MTRLPAWFSLVALLLPVSGCGYRNLAWRAGGARVQLPPLRNQTREPAVEAPLTEALSRELIRAGFALSGPGEQADYLLAGAVTAFEAAFLYYPREYTGPDHPVRVTAVLNMELSAAPAPAGAPGRPEQRREFRETRYFYRTGPFARPESEAVEAVAGALARRVVEWLLDARR